MTGSASAFFLWALDLVTRWQWRHPLALAGLPFAGLLVGLLYHLMGKDAEKGSNLIIDEIHEPDVGVPGRMAPLVLFGTLMTHAFGGSAGREGTAIQMGGGLAGLLARAFKMDREGQRVMLKCGVAAGFGSVFGTPFAGAIFAMEVLTIGRIHFGGWLPVLLASFVGDEVCLAWGTHHAAYPFQAGLETGDWFWFDGWMLLNVGVVACLFGLIGRGFAVLTHGIQHFFKNGIAYAPLRPFFGGLLVIGMVWVTGSREYLGLGVDAGPSGGVSILASFQAGGAETWDWLGKTLFTAVTLGSGFKGGEVTPLFFIGSTLGNSLGGVMGAPVGLFAALGFLSVFAGASKTPTACTIMGIELFGGQYAIAFGFACFVAFACSGHQGIYRAQRRSSKKRVEIDRSP